MGHLIMNIDYGYFSKGEVAVKIPYTVFEHDTKVHQLVIHYTNGAKYHVKNARHIKIIKHRGGGYDVEYHCAKKINDDVDFGRVSGTADMFVKTETHDVKGVTLETKPSSNIVEKRYVEVK